MSVEPQRSQYLEAMGLTPWVSRYRLVNAAPTPACEWIEPEAAPAQPPAQRLHALLDDAERAPATPSPEPAGSPRQAVGQGGRARALLETHGAAIDPPAEPVAAPDESVPAADVPAGESPVSLRFSLQIAALDGRWLVLLPGASQPDATLSALLANLFQAAGIVPGAAPEFQAFRWPMMEGQPVEAPLNEARDGLRAFVDGRRRRGWRPERLLVFGADETLAPVLALENRHCELLGIPGWQGPSLEALANSAEAKRALWPTLQTWREAWHGAAGGEEADTPAGNDAPAS